jgi:predicted thioredoxin/glutaredoxin
VKVVLVTRQSCHLCEDALASLRSLGVEPELRDVDADPQLFDLYDWRVPIVLVGGRVIAEGHVDVDMLRKALKSA